MDSTKPSMTMFAGPNGSGKSTTVQTFLQTKKIVFINPDDIGRRITYMAQADAGLAFKLIELGRAFTEKRMHKETQSDLAKLFYKADQGKSIVEPVTKKEITQNLEGTELYNHLQTRLDTTQSALVTGDHHLLIGINLVAAQVADELKELYIRDGTSFAIAEHGGFAFETVMSSPKSIDHLVMAKKAGFETTTFYITTSNSQINVYRVSERARQGGHSIDPDTIVKRHASSLSLLPKAVLVSDSTHIMDTTNFENIRTLELRKDMSPLERMAKLQGFLEKGKFPKEVVDKTRKMKAEEQQRLHKTVMTFHDWTSSELVPNIRELIDRIPSPIKEKIQEQLREKDSSQKTLE